ncbi:FliH/SctL family protein [Tistrella mobilis]|jgi:flagellar assembly protein FliH|uniref:FliH/SctL family protein n=1 Tax=Tistrella mobilis TaxID=171437 RepID=UPI003558687F
MAGYKKFTFDVSFDDDIDFGRPRKKKPEPVVEAAPVPPPPPPPPTFSEAQLAAAQAAAFEEGRRAGAAQAMAAIEQQTLQAIQRLERQSAEAIHGWHDRLDATTADLVRLARMIAVKLGCTEEQRLDRIETMLRDCIAGIAETGEAVLHVHPAAEAVMSARVAPVLAEEGVLGQCRVIADPGIAPGDARLVWPGGMAVLSREDILQRIDEALAEATAPGHGSGMQHLTPGHAPSE